MAFAVGTAVGAAVAAGFAVGSSCNLRVPVLDTRRSTRRRRNDDDMSDSEVYAPAPARTRAPRQEKAEPADAIVNGWEGFSMEEARAHADEGQALAFARTPAEVLAALQRGNTRFWMNTAVRPERSAFERRALISKQFPSVAILGCSDSRVPTEIVFDQGLGDLFVIRVAGNCLDTATLASLQYAIHHLKVKVVVVMGHEMCGAIKAAQLPVDKLENEPIELMQTLKSLKFGLDENALKNVRDTRSHDREAVTTNVRAQVERLQRDTGISQKVKQDELLVVGAFYELSSGIVDFIDTNA